MPLPGTDLRKIVNIMKDMPEGDGKNLLWLLAATGSRASDAARLTTEQIKFRGGKGRHTYLDVQWRITKTARTRRQRTQTSYPIAWSCQPPTDFMKRMARPGRLFPFQHQDAASIVNKMLKTHNLTSYSIRRAFIQQGIELSGDTDMVAKMANHKPTTLEAHYKRW